MNKKYIGIIAAEEKEMLAIKEKMNNIEQIQIYNLLFFKGNINNKEYILVQCGVGKVNAARTTQILIDKFEIESIINIGSAGGINENLKIGDIVIGEQLVQHDFDVTAFGREKGYISDTGKFFKSDKSLIEQISKKLKNNQQKFNVIIGTIATGDTFLTNVNQKEIIKNEFNCDCIEMEGAAVAQVCTLDNIPFVVIRGISDVPNEKNNIDFDAYLNIISKRIANSIF